MRSTFFDIIKTKENQKSLAWSNDNPDKKYTSLACKISDTQQILIRT